MPFDRDREQAYRRGDQYLLSKAMMVLQAIVIIAAVGALAAAAVATWNVLVPSGEVRQAARDHRGRLAEQQAAATNAAAAVSNLDSQWAANQNAVLAKFRNERAAWIKAASKELANVETSLTTYGNEYVKNLLSEQQQRAAQSIDSQSDLGTGRTSSTGWSRTTGTGSRIGRAMPSGSGTKHGSRRRTRSSSCAP